MLYDQINSTFNIVPESFSFLKGDIQYDFESPITKSISVKLEQPKNYGQDIIFDAFINDSEAALKLQSPFIGFQQISAEAKWQLNLEEPHVELGVSRNDFNAHMILNGTFSTWCSSFAFKALHNQGYLEKSVSFTSEYDLSDTFYSLTELTIVNTEGNSDILQKYFITSN